MKNTGFAAWKARLEWFKSEYQFGPIQRFTNEEGRLHRDDGPALITPTRVTWYRNGRKHGMDADKFGTVFYYFENIRVPPHYVTNPDKIELSEVLTHPNAEVRFVGMKALGMEKVLASGAAKIVDKDDEKGQILFHMAGIFPDPVCYVKVVNSTPEADGTYKDYYLCVPPNMRTCRQAVAWTFGLSEARYQPSQET